MRMQMGEANYVSDAVYNKQSARNKLQLDCQG